MDSFIRMNINREIKAFIILESQFLNVISNIFNCVEEVFSWNFPSFFINIQISVSQYQLMNQFFLHIPFFLIIINYFLSDFVIHKPLYFQNCFCLSIFIIIEVTFFVIFKNDLGCSNIIFCDINVHDF